MTQQSPPEHAVTDICHHYALTKTDTPALLRLQDHAACIAHALQVVSVIRMAADLVVADLIHELEALQRLAHCDANVLLGQRTWPEAVVEVEETLVPLDTEEGSHILVIWQRS